MPSALNIKQGAIYGNLTVVHEVVAKRRTFLCLCSCTSETKVRADHLLSGHTKSCGCLQKKKVTKHGLHKDPLYNVWLGMKKRCLDPTAHSYKNYGGRGIKICARWLALDNFIKDMRDTYKEGFQLERIDNSGPYTPANCTWVSVKSNNRNKRNNLLITYQGETKTLAEWAETANIKYSVLYYRIKQGWSVEKALDNYKQG